MRTVTPELAHMLGDYVVQTSWMASEKTSRNAPAAVHAATYTACFLPVTRNWKALAVIGGTHFVIDRWRLAKYLCWAKNQAAPQRYRYPFSESDDTGYRATSPPFLNTWLMILADNAAHLLINRWALGREAGRTPPC